MIRYPRFVNQTAVHAAPYLAMRRLDHLPVLRVHARIEGAVAETALLVGIIMAGIIGAVLRDPLVPVVSPVPAVDEKRRPVPFDDRGIASRPAASHAPGGEKIVVEPDESFGQGMGYGF